MHGLHVRPPTSAGNVATSVATLIYIATSDWLVSHFNYLL